MYPLPGYSMHPDNPMGMRVFPDHGDGFGEYYGMDQLNKEEADMALRSPVGRSRRSRKQREVKHSRSSSRSGSVKSRSYSKSRSRSRSRSRSLSHTRSRSRSPLGIYPGKDIKHREPSVLDAFRVLYLSPSRQSKTHTAKYLATKKKQDRIEEYLKSDGLGSKKWLFYPRPSNTQTEEIPDIKSTTIRESCDQRVKIDAVFFRKYKRNKRVASDSPIAKLKRWELILYKKLGFIHAV